MENNFDSIITELNQRKLFHFKQFKLYGDRLFYKNKNLVSSFELDIPFEDLTNQVIYKKTSKPLFWGFSAFFLIVFITKTYYLFVEPNFDFGVYFVVAILFFLCCLAAFLGQQDLMLIKAVNPQFIEIFNKRPDEKSVTDFHIKLRKTTKEYLVKKYVYEAAFSLEQRKQNLNTLKDKWMIDDFDFKMISAKIDNTPVDNQIGFKFS